MKFFSGLSIFWQTLLLIAVALTGSLIVNLSLIMATPQPRFDFYALVDLAEILEDPQGRLRGNFVDPNISIAYASTPPVAAAGMRHDDDITRQLATRLNVPLDRIRLFYEADQSNPPFRYFRNTGGVPIRLGEPQFYNTVITALQLDDGHWKIVRTPPRPLINRFHVRQMEAFVLSFMVILPLAYYFARQIARPVRRFVDATEQIGWRNSSPPVPVAGAVELKTAAEAINKMQRNVADMVAERTAMVGAIAHDLRTPLARIAFRVEQGPDDLRRAVNSDIDQMQRIITSTMSFVKGSSVGRYDYQIENLRTIIEKIAEQAAHLGNDVSAKIDDTWIWGDAPALERLFQNLVDNSITYAGSCRISGKTKRNEALIFIDDDGPGLPDDRLEDVFQAFGRGDRSRNLQTGGIGLGLTIARSIVNAHNGTIVACNRDTGGLRIIITMPLAKSMVTTEKSRKRKSTEYRVPTHAPAEVPD